MSETRDKYGTVHIIDGNTDTIIDRPPMGEDFVGVVTHEKPTTSFTFRLEGYYVLSADEIWADGDAPTDPTIEDVLTEIAKEGGAQRFISDACLDEDLELIVDGRRVP